jgi:hypothetical protein
MGMTVPRHQFHWTLADVAVYFPSKQDYREAV